MMFTVNEIATKLKISRSSVYNAIETGDLPHHRFGAGRGTIRISEEQLQQYLERTRVEEQSSTRDRLCDVQYRGKSDR